MSEFLGSVVNLIQLKLYQPTDEFFFITGLQITLKNCRYNINEKLYNIKAIEPPWLHQSATLIRSHLDVEIRLV